MPSKRSRRDRRNVNGSSSKRGTRRNHSSSDEHDDKKNLRSSKSISNKNKNKSYVESSSEDDSDFKNKTRNKLRKKKPRESSSESSEKDRKKSKSHRSAKKNMASDDSDCTKKSRSTKKPENSSSDDSNDERSVRIKKKVAEIEVKRKVVSSGREDSSLENNKRSSKKLSLKKEKSTSSERSSEEKIKSKDSKIGEKVEETKLSSKSSATLSAEDVIIKKKIKLAILWLNNTVKDIAELGTLVSVRAKKFGDKKNNPDNLKTYEDVLNTVTKLKQLISGVHSNYEHIEKNLDAQLKPWKVLIGKDNKGCATPTQEGETTIDRSQTNTNVLPESNDTLSFANNSHDKVPLPENESAKEDKTEPQANDGQFELNWSGDDSDNNEKINTKDLISKANESLDKMDELEKIDECKVSSGLELKNLKGEVTNKSPNTSSSEKLADDNDKSSKVLANDSDEEKLIKIFPSDTEKVISCPYLL